MNETQELQAIKAFMDQIMETGELRGSEGMKVALENLKVAQRLELSLRTKEATELMRRVRTDMAANLVSSLEEPLKSKVAKAIEYGDFEVRAQMYIDFFKAIPQLPPTATIPVGPLAARGKELYFEVLKYAPEDTEMADEFRDMIEFYESATKTPPKLQN